MKEAIHIRPLKETDSITEITRLLHRAYAELGVMGLKYTAVDQSEAMTRKRIDGGRCFVAEYDGALAGVITYYPPDKGQGAEWYEQPDVAHFGQFGVDPDRRGLGIGSGLIAHVEEIARGEGVGELALDTAEDASNLVDMYKKMGYRIVETHSWIVANYRSVIMSKSLEN